MAAKRGKKATGSAKQVPRSRMHHYLPVSYLKRFTDQNKYLHILDFQEQKTFKTKPQNVAKIRDFYTTKTIDNSEDDSVEKFIASVEGKAAPVFNRIISENRIDHDSDEWCIACNFIALLDRRLPISREGYKQTAEFVMNVVADAAFGTRNRLNATLKRIEADTGNKLDLDFQSARRLIDEGCISADVPRNEHIRVMLETAARLVPLIWNMTPHLLVAKEGHFVTGDCPLAKRNRQPPGVLEGVGWALPTIEVAFPIGQQHCIVLTWDPAPRVLAADRLAVANINCQIAKWAMRYVLGPQERFVWMDRDESIRTGPKALMKKLAERKTDQRLIHSWPPRPETPAQEDTGKPATSAPNRTKPTKPARKRHRRSRSRRHSS